MQRLAIWALALATFALCVLTWNGAFAQALIPNAQQQFVDANGQPLAGGSVYFYVPGTTTPKATYQNQGLTVVNTNPVVLNSAGRATIWGSGSYREVVYDQFGTLVWDQLTFASGGPPTATYAVDSGLVNAMVITLSPIPASMNALVGIPITIKVAVTNTLDTPTLNINGLGAYNVVTRGAGGVGPLGVGTAAANKIITVVWDGTNFQYLDRIVTASVAQIQAGTDFISPITSIGLAGAMPSIVANAGYQKFPTGTYLVWGTGTTTTGVAEDYNLSVPLPTHIDAVTCFPNLVAGPTTVVAQCGPGPSLSQIRVGMQEWNGATFVAATGRSFSFIVVGH